MNIILNGFRIGDVDKRQALGNKSVFWIEPDCFIVNIVFAWEQAIGKTTQSEVGMIGSHRFPMYRPVNDRVDIDYLISYFLTKRGTDILETAVSYTHLDVYKRQQKHRRYRRNRRGKEMNMKSVQISYDLFVALVEYHLAYDDDYAEEIHQGLEQKLDAMVRHELYAKYKTAPTAEEREQARQAYLDKRGVFPDFRW